MDIKDQVQAAMRAEHQRQKEQQSREAVIIVGILALFGAIGFGLVLWLQSL